MAEKKQSEQKLKATQFGIHTIRNLLGSQDQLSLFSERREELKKSGLNLDGIDRFGFDLSEVEFKVMEGILKELTRTRYQGNISPKEKEEILNEKISTGDPQHAYKYIEEIPRIRATQSQIFEWAGIRNDSAGEKERAVDALSHLGKTVYCFYYERLAHGADGKPEKNSKGRWKKEEVMAVDTLFMIKEVRDNNSKRLKYYEIEPSSIFLDQRENFYILIPHDWREEVQQISGTSRVSSYTFRFLIFLRYQFEMKRRSDFTSKPYQIKWSSEEIAFGLKMPEKTVRRNKKQTNKILDESYAIAKKLGYLTDYERSDCLDVLTLNDEKFESLYQNKGLKASALIQVASNISQETNKQAEEIFELFYSERKKVDPKHSTPTGITKTKDLEKFGQLLANRTFDEITSLVRWGMTHKYWWSHFSTPTKFMNSFSEAWGEMSLSFKGDPKRLSEINRMLAKKLCESYHSENPKLTIDALNKDLVLADGRGSHCSLAYEDKEFRKKLEHIIQKWDISAQID